MSDEYAYVLVARVKTVTGEYNVPLKVADAPEDLKSHAEDYGRQLQAMLACKLVMPTPQGPRKTPHTTQSLLGILGIQMVEPAVMRVLRATLVERAPSGLIVPN